MLSAPTLIPWFMQQQVCTCDTSAGDAARGPGDWTGRGGCDRPGASARAGHMMAGAACFLQAPHQPQEPTLVTRDLQNPRLEFAGLSNATSRGKGPIPPSPPHRGHPRTRSHAHRRARSGNPHGPEAAGGAGLGPATGRGPGLGGPGKGRPRPTGRVL